jgi:hypothetical protein
VSARRIVRDSKKPSAKQFAISYLAGFAVNGDHDFLSQIFGQGLFVAVASEECHDLW